ncbi:MAG: ATP-binding protein [Candidatus Pacebacteria bacterium]|nr:ATP-binding protein [Candidatus Paceibacterota bacterium]MBP9818663.1 ATP-binding protein [Candidatus Paceibacterota bacterium]
MQNESKPFGVKATNSFKRNFNQSILKLSFLYGAILVTILCISGVITFNEFSGRVGKRFNTIPPTITIQLPNGNTITNKPLVRREELKQAEIRQLEQKRDQQMPTAADIRADLIASLIFVNGILLLLASIASYWLARLTLKPIQVAYEKQRRFLGDASHELRTPLSILQIELENELHTINSNEKNAAARNANTQNRAVREAIESKLEEVQRMSKLVGDLLTLSRLDDDATPRLRKTSRLTIVEFSSLINKIIERLTPLAHTHAVSLSYIDEINNTQNSNSKSNTPNTSKSTSANAFKNKTVIIDEELLSHALTNLIQNAIFYNKKDGSVQVKMKPHGKRIRVTITDTGVGINEHDLQHIFDRFYRADKSRTRSNVKHSGSGLGLSIAKTTLAHMNATLYLTSEVDKGTIATVEFLTQ